jgi:hypothetical protein
MISIANKKLNGGKFGDAVEKRVNFVILNTSDGVFTNAKSRLAALTVLRFI